MKLLQTILVLILFLVAQSTAAWSAVALSQGKLKLSVGSQLVWTDEFEYNQISRPLKIAYKQTPLNKFVEHNHILLLMCDHYGRVFEIYHNRVAEGDIIVAGVCPDAEMLGFG